MMVHGFGDRDSLDWALLSGPLPEEGDRIRFPKRCVLKNKQGGVFDKNRTMDNVQEHNICTNVPSSQTSRSYQLLTKSQENKQADKNKNTQQIIYYFSTFYSVPKSSSLLHSDANIPDTWHF
jgi:hypothetical protein